MVSHSASPTQLWKFKAEHGPHNDEPYKDNTPKNSKNNRWMVDIVDAVWRNSILVWYVFWGFAHAGRRRRTYQKRIGCGFAGVSAEKVALLQPSHACKTVVENGEHRAQRSLIELVGRARSSDGDAGNCVDLLCENLRSALCLL